MKKIFFFLFSGIALFATASHAQTVNAAPADGAEPSASAARKMMKANGRALDRFRKDFRDGPDVSWNTEAKVITATCNRDGKQIQAVYDRKGRWIRNMATYGEDKLPREVRHAVRSEFYDYKITLAHEITEGDITFFVVHLEDAKSYKQVSFYDGEVRIFKEYNKSL